jgi:hypothetical protein
MDSKLLFFLQRVPRQSLSVLNREELKQFVPVRLQELHGSVLTDACLKQMTDFGDDRQGGHQSFIDSRRAGLGDVMKVVASVEQGHPKAGIGNDHPLFPQVLFVIDREVLIVVHTAEQAMFFHDVQNLARFAFRGWGGFVQGLFQNVGHQFGQGLIETPLQCEQTLGVDIV